MAATIANGFAAEYVSQNLGLKRAKIDQQLKRITTLLADADARIQVGQRMLIDTASRGNVLDVDTVNRLVGAAQLDVMTRTREMQAAEIRAKDMAALDPEKNLDAALNGPDTLRDVLQIRNQINELTRQRSALMGSGRGAGSPDVISLDRQIEDANDNLKQEIRLHINAAQSAYQTAVAQRDAAEREYKAKAELQVENSRSGIPYQSLRQRVEADETSRNSMLSQKNKLDILAKGMENNVRVVETTPTPLRPYKPDTLRILTLWLAAGLAAAAAVVLIQSRRHLAGPAAPA